MNGVTVMGYSNLPSRIAADECPRALRQEFAGPCCRTCSPARTNRSSRPKWDDEIVKAAVLTRDGAVINPALKEA